MSAPRLPARISRRLFLETAAGAVSGLALAAATVSDRLRRPHRRPDPRGAVPEAQLSPIDQLPPDIERTWLGPAYWANRLEDWRLHAGRIECLLGSASTGMCTVALLTRDIPAGNGSGAISVRTGTLAGGASGGFSGFLVGAGAGRLDYRAAALVQGASGAGGGLLCTYDSDGSIRFREHTDEVHQLTYAALAATAEGGPRPPRSLSEDVELRLTITPAAGGRFSLTMQSVRFASGSLLATATLPDVPGDAIAGGIALASSARDATGGARYWFRDVRTGGTKLQAHPTRAWGPILGALYSVSGSVLKVSAHLAPIGASEPQRVTLQVREATGVWRTRGSAIVGDDGTAIFRVTGWDASRAAAYRIRYAGSSGVQQLAGNIQQEPATSDQLTVGVVNCSIHSFRELDGPSSGVARIPGEHPLGLYTPRNLYFPYAELVGNLRKQRPDLLAFLGDQYYNRLPTREPVVATTLDVRYRYGIWLWAFGDLARDTPSVTLVDDHDVYQGNLWGHGGAPAPHGDERLGGYVQGPALIDAIQRVQCGHNPDPFDPAPVQQGIGVYYAAFTYGGVSFAILEDRKFKTGNATGTDPGGDPLPQSALELLGSRQEAFLRQWGVSDAGMPKVCFTQTLWACLETDPGGHPVQDWDTDAYPAARRRALALVKQAGAVLVNGDQHLASLVRHGLRGFTDGPIQFTAPAAGSGFQRWFEPAAPLPNGAGTPDTGDFTDAFGNRLHVLAVANPKVTFATYRRYHRVGQDLGDRALKRDGYGVLRVDKAQRRHVIECWPWNVDPGTSPAGQYAGWPYTLPFSRV